MEEQENEYDSLYDVMYDYGINDVLDNNNKTNVTNTDINSNLNISVNNEDVKCKSTNKLSDINLSPEHKTLKNSYDYTNTKKIKYIKSKNRSSKNLFYEINGYNNVHKEYVDSFFSNNAVSNTSEKKTVYAFDTVTNGATTNGATTNGATTNGATTNGATTNNATTNDATTTNVIKQKTNNNCTNDTSIIDSWGISNYIYDNIHKYINHKNLKNVNTNVYKSRYSTATSSNDNNKYSFEQNTHNDIMVNEYVDKVKKNKNVNVLKENEIHKNVGNVVIRKGSVNVYATDESVDKHNGEKLNSGTFNLSSEENKKIDNDMYKNSINVEENGTPDANATNATNATNANTPDADATNANATNANATNANATNTNTNNENEGKSTFECNICFDDVRDPVVTKCGHLFCWLCLSSWIKKNNDCPVCKAEVSKENVIPLYGRGKSSSGHKYTNANEPRPTPKRKESSRRGNSYSNNLGLRASFGVWINPFSFGLSYTNMSEEPYFNESNNRTDSRRVQTETFHAEAASSFFFFLGFFLSLYILFYSS